MSDLLISFFGENFLKPSTETLMACLQVIVYGLAGVFTVLILFFIITKILIMVSNMLTRRDSE